MKILLDTNVCIALMRKHAKAMARSSGIAPDQCAVSTVSVYELFTGAAKSHAPEIEHAKVHRLLSVMRVLPFDAAAAERAAQVRAALERAGKVCGPYDLLLAGHALSLGLPLATNNVREFVRIDELQIEDWLS